MEMGNLSDWHDRPSSGFKKAEGDRNIFKIFLKVK